MRTRQIIILASVLLIFGGCRSHKKTYERHEEEDTRTVLEEKIVGGIDSAPAPQKQEIKQVPPKTTRIEEIIQESEETIVIQ